MVPSYDTGWMDEGGGGPEFCMQKKVFTRKSVCGN